MRVIALLFNPITMEIIFRGIIPIYWVFTHLYYAKHKEILFFHFVYLCFLVFLDLLLLLKFYKIAISEKYILPIQSYRSFIPLFIFLILFFSMLIPYMTINNFIGITGEYGSDTLVFLNEDNKVKTWLVYGVLSLVSLLTLIISIMLKKLSLKMLTLFLALIGFILPGKKSGIILLLQNYILIYFLLHKAEKLLSFTSLRLRKKTVATYILILILAILAFIYLFFIYRKTMEAYSGEYTYFLLISQIVDIIYASSTVYLDQFIILDGVNFAKDYSEMLGNFGFFKYFLNPITKLLFNTGVYKAIGPYMGEVLFGYEIPYGVNPTLFFEMFFVTGNIVIGFLISILLLFLVYKIQSWILMNLNLRSIKLNRPVELSIYILYNLKLLFFTIAFKHDSLNAIRSLPFVLLAYFALILVRKIKNKQR